MALAEYLAGLQETQYAEVAQIGQFSNAVLGAIRRRSGEDYACHCSEVASVLREATADPFLLGIALLHDLPVHPQGEALLKKAPLEREQRRLITHMHELRRLHLDESQADLDVAVDAFVTEPRLVLLRTAHRVNDIRHSDRFPVPLRRQLASEALHMYSAIAGRLGLHAWRRELEDTCFRIVQPRIAARLQEQFDAAAALDALCLQHTADFLQRKLAAAGLRSTIDSRRKGLYSSYRKMALKGRRFEELTDRLALRIVLDDMQDCYRALGIVHNAMRPMPGKLKDYIGAPKENGYRSIHTVVYPLPGITEQPIEVQIRTRDMHEVCEFGSLAHGDYKEAVYALRAGGSRVNLSRNLLVLHAGSRSPEEFEDALRHFFREDHIAVFDHSSALAHVPKGATALDVACILSPERVSTLNKVRINGRERPLSTVVRDGDTVEAIGGRTRTVEKSWLSMCELSQGKSVLQGFLKKQVQRVQRARKQKRG